MSTQGIPQASPVGAPPGRSTNRAWSAVTAILSWAIFAQAVFAGFLLSGDDWGRTAHRTNANLLTLVTLTVAIVAAVRLRGRPQHRRMTVLLFSLVVGIAIQHRTGIMASDGNDVLWLHVPMGVAVVWLSAQAMMCARTLE